MGKLALTLSAEGSSGEAQLVRSLSGWGHRGLFSDRGLEFRHKCNALRQHTCDRCLRYCKTPRHASRQPDYYLETAMKILFGYDLLSYSGLKNTTRKKNCIGVSRYNQSGPAILKQRELNCPGTFPVSCSRRRPLFLQLGRSHERSSLYPRDRCMGALVLHPSRRTNKLPVVSVGTLFHFYYPKALRTHILRFLGPKIILYKAFGPF